MRNHLKGKILLVLAVVLMCTSCIRTKINWNKYIKTGGPIPEFVVMNNNGETVTYDSFAQGEGLIIFFDLNCSDCIRELPNIDRFQKRNPGWRILAIGRGHTMEEIADYWNRKGLEADYAPDPDRNIYNMFADKGVPLLIYTKDGIITRIEHILI